jgi:uncharacterized coiled-coil protein SlyX
MNIPVYNIIINEGDETGCTAISLVDNPAVELPFLCFDKETSLFKADNDKHIISGIAILADTPIYRCSPTRGEYYVVFSKETIRQIVQKYAKNQQFNIVNLQHDDDTFVNTIHMVESLIIDKERGLCPVEFSDVPDGSWYISYHVEDETLWDQIKNTEHLNGFSIELLSELELKMESNKENNSMNKFFKLAKAILKLEEVKTDKETLIIEGEIEVGKPVFIETEEGPVPAADGEYKLEDETVIVIAEGVIAEVRPVEETPEEEVKPEELEEENPVEETPEEDPKIAELEARIKELEAEIETKDARIAELEAKVAEQEEKLKMSVEEPITKKVINRENKALKYFG